MGRLLNSGWNWTPRQNRSPGTSTASTSRPSGEVAADDHAGVQERLAELVVELVAVAVALGNLGLAVGPLHLGAGLNDAGVRAQAHGAALGDVALLVGHQVDDAVAAFRVRTRWKWRPPSPGPIRAYSITAICIPRQMPK